MTTRSSKSHPPIFTMTYSGNNMNPQHQDQHHHQKAQSCSDSSHSRMSSPSPQSPSSVSPYHPASTSSSSTSTFYQAQAVQHGKVMMNTKVPDPMLALQPSSAAASSSASTSATTTTTTTSVSQASHDLDQVNETKNGGLTRKGSRSFSFQLYEATNNCQNLTFSPQKKMTQEEEQEEELGNQDQQLYKGGNDVLDRKEKRLQRNRESARLSRRRRKQYLEVLESRVNYLCDEMDKGRRDHVLIAISQIEKLRSDLLMELEQDVLPVKKAMDGGSEEEHLAQLLDIKIGKLENGGDLSRSSTELMLAVTFGTQYLKSLVIPPYKKYAMWLILQNELFFRGGRAASERLSAARIGEKLLNSGCKHVSPANGMWPLFCHEIALSYDQEEKIRQLQREIVSNQETWLHRHTGVSTEHVIESSHAAICGISEACEKRAKTLMDVLTPVQKAKFLVWVAKKRKQDAVSWTKIVSSHYDVSRTQGQETFNVDPKNHDAANLYILNHKLKLIADAYARSRQVYLSHEALKKFSRRPAFESLASVDEVKSSTKGGMTKVGSSGALKRCSSELSCDVMNGRGFLKKSTSGTSLGVASTITPDVAQATYSSYVHQVLGSVTNLIPRRILVHQTYKEHEHIQPLPIHTNSNTLQEKRRAIHINQPGNQALYAIDSAPSAALPASLISTSKSHNQFQKFVNIPLPEPAPITTLHRNALLGSYLESAGLDPLVMPPVSYTNNPLVSREQHTYLSAAASAPNFSAYSKVPSPVQSIPKEEDYSNIDDIGLWNVSNQMADDSLFDLTEEDWAIGEGAFFE
mmetsp:Transcript_15379/g.28969  ORF Transcript_15379/g.28969 Transcript_15379/m.28969 type:complete len:805 (+) Transcript_15379:151-2565(+)